MTIIRRGPSGIPTEVVQSVTGLAYVPTNEELNVFATGASSAFKVVQGDSFEYSGSDDFVLTADGCVLTYQGDTKDFEAEISLTFKLDLGDENPANCGLAVSHNGDIVGFGWGIPAVLAGGMGQSVQGEDVFWHYLSSARRLTLSPGDTIQPIFAVSSPRGSATIVAMTLAVSAL